MLNSNATFFFDSSRVALHDFSSSPVKPTWDENCTTAVDPRVEENRDDASVYWPMSASFTGNNISAIQVALVSISHISLTHAKDLTV